MRRAMYRLVQPSGGGDGTTVTINCTTTNELECFRRCPGVDNCPDFAAPPPPPLPHVSIDVGSSNFPVRFLLTVSLLSAFLFLSLVLFALFLYRRRLLLRRRRRALPRDGGFADGDEEAGGGGTGEEVQHHVWYIRTVGLDDATIASIATKEYRGVGSGGDCAVCLGDFKDGELVRLLPRCAHPFHAPCIDTWLRAHVNCPLCRSPVVVSSDPPASVPDAETVGGEAEEHQVFELEEISPSESLAEAHEDSESSLITQSKDTEAATEENGMASSKPIRRSVSMDSPLFLVVVPEAEDDAAQANRKLPSNQEMRMFRVKEKEATPSASCLAGRFGISRSMSSSGRRFFARSERSSGNVLPL